MFHNIKDKTAFVRSEALKLGFDAVGFSKAQKLPLESERLVDWLNAGYQGDMSYMADHFEKRTDPTELVPGAKTVVSFTFNYFTDKQQKDSSAPVVSKYAFGRDYHKVLKNKLKKLLLLLKDNLGVKEGRYFVDSAPVLERAWAARSGLGWIGKNTLLIHPKKGSYFFLAELVIDVELAYDSPINDHCGSCRRCIDACPTQAISDQGYFMDGSKCISYATIELKEDIPSYFKDKMKNRVFGCDICMDVCPWNKFSVENSEGDFTPKEEFLEMDAAAWSNLDLETYERLFNGTALRRPKFNGIERNIIFLSKE